MRQVVGDEACNVRAVGLVRLREKDSGVEDLLPCKSRKAILSRRQGEPGSLCKVSHRRQSHWCLSRVFQSCPTRYLNQDQARRNREFLCTSRHPEQRKCDG